MEKNVELRLFVGDEQVVAVSCKKRHFTSGQHSREEIMKTMVERINNFLDMQEHDPVI